MIENKEKQLVASIPDDVFKKLKHLSVDLDKTMRELLISAILDLVAKYENQNIVR